MVVDHDVVGIETRLQHHRPATFLLTTGSVLVGCGGIANDKDGCSLVGCGSHKQQH